MTSSRKERKERITRMRKQQILDAALKVFSEKGFEEATNADIAEIAGIAPGTIYNYFHSKRELLVEVVNNFLVTEQFLHLFEHAGEMEYLTFLESVLDNRMNFVEDSVKTQMLLLMAEILRDAELREIYNRQVVKPVINRMEKFLEDRADAGEFRRVNPTIITRALGGMVLGIMLLTLLEGDSSPLRKTSREELASEIGGLVMAGIRQQ
jgi:AcrR family transcriptional regulator